MRPSVLSATTVVALALAGLVATAPAQASPVSPSDAPQTDLAPPATDGATGDTGTGEAEVLQDRLSGLSDLAVVDTVEEPTAQACDPLADGLVIGAVWQVGDHVVSPSGEFVLLFDEYGLGVFQAPSVWSPTGAFRGDIVPVRQGSLASTLTFQTSNGNVVARDAANLVVGDARIHGLGGQLLRVQDDGDVAVYGDPCGTGTPITDFGLDSPDLLYPGAVLRPGATMTGDGGLTGLQMQTNGNLVLRQGGLVAWHAGTHGNTGAVAVIQDNGNLVVRSATNRVLWALGTHLQGESVLLLEHGSVYVTTTDNESTTHLFVGYDWLRPGMSLSNGQRLVSYGGEAVLTMQTNGNLVLRVDGRVEWTSWTFSPGGRVTMQPNGNLVIRSNTGRVMWTSNTFGTNLHLGLFGTDGVSQIVDESGTPTGEVFGVVDIRRGEVLWAV